MTDYTVVRYQQLSQQESYEFQVMEQLNIELCVYFIWGSCGYVGYIRQGAFFGETVVWSAYIDKHQQLKVSISN